MLITIEQVHELAPGSASASAGNKQMALKNWPELGQTDAALWGKCQGSTVFRVKFDLSNLGYHGNCLSRKFPCKNVLGLLMLLAESPADRGQARFEIEFNIDGNERLLITARDLHTAKLTHKDSPVVKLK